MQALDRFNLVGTLVDGRYRVERVVGEGGFGVVYRAHHVRLDGLVALKVLKLPDDPMARDAMVAAFENEGKILFSLASRHAGFVRVLESGSLLSATGQVTPYLVLEWLDGVTLDVELEHRRDRGLPAMRLHEMIGLLDAPVRALAAAHCEGIAHRDVKPANLFLTLQDGVLAPKVLDLGTAKLIEQSLGATSVFSRTEGAACSFTPAYGAPEQWRRELGATGPWTDVHALALLCLEVLTGRPPYDGYPASILSACVDERRRPTPRTFGLDVTDGVEEAFRRALAVNPRDRISRAGDFWQAVCGEVQPSEVHVPMIASLSGLAATVLAPGGTGASIPAGPTEPSRSGGARRMPQEESSGGATPGPASVTPGSRGPHRSARLILGSVSLLLLVVAVVIGLGLRMRADPTPAQPLVQASAAAPTQEASGMPTERVIAAAVDSAPGVATSRAEADSPRPVPGEISRGREPNAKRSPAVANSAMPPASTGLSEPELFPSRRK
jgi:serine/threonine-protein kinase